MQKRLVILLHAHDLAHPSWTVLDTQAQVTQSVERGDAAELSAIAHDRVVTVIVPGEDVLLTAVTLPKMNRSRLLQAIPYALEEQVIDDVETMHFAVGPYQADALLPVVVVARDKMSEWVALLQSWSVSPDAILPSMLALPVLPDAWSVQVSDVAVVRMGVASGFACDTANLHEMLTMALSTLETPTQIQVEIGQHEPTNLVLPVPVQERKVSLEHLLEVMAAQVAEAPLINLLQGDFQNKKTRRMPKLTNVLKVSAYLLVVWVALLFLYPVISFGILSQRDSEIKSQIASIYKKQFPGSSSMVAPKERLQQKLTKLTADFGENHLLLVMANIGKGLASAPGVQLRRLDFQNNVMTLEISAASSDVFSAFTDALTHEGLRVKQQNANLSGARVSATLQIE